MMNLMVLMTFKTKNSNDVTANVGYFFKELYSLPLDYAVF